MHDQGDAAVAHFLRVEAVGFRSFIEDTSDLNTIRGGGLIALNAARDLATRGLGLDAGLAAQRVVAAEASIAVVDLGLLRPSQAKKLRADLADWLANERDYRDAVFVVDIVASQGTYAADLQRLTLSNRVRQLQEPSLVFPEWRSAVPTPPSNRNSPAWPACEEDRVRPVIPGVHNDLEADEKRQWISRATATRRRIGKEAKKDFYVREAQLPVEDADEFVHGFSWDFQQLSSFPPSGAEHLRGKLAVIYVDGNGFGKILETVATNPTEHRRFSDRVVGHRRQYLSALLQVMRGTDDRWPNSWRVVPVSKDGEVPSKRTWRLEILLWGGDEFMLVVPAWQGWETLSLFFECCSPPGCPTLRFESRDSKGAPLAEYPLKFGAGLVFTHHKAPFHRVSDLARNLCRLAKTDRTRNAYACAVLESFDNFGASIEDSILRQGFIAPGETVADLFTFPGEGMRRIADGVRALKTGRPEFPRSRIHDLAKQGLANARAKALLPRHLATFSDEVNAMENQLGGRAMWLHLASLWDYVVPEEAGI